MRDRYLLMYLFQKMYFGKNKINLFLLEFRLQARYMQLFPFGKLFIQHHEYLVALVQICYENKYAGTTEQFQDGRGGGDIEYYQKSSVFKYIPSEQWRSQGRISRGGQNMVAPGRMQEVKQGVASRTSCKTVVALRGGGIDLLSGSVSPSTGNV